MAVTPGTMQPFRFMDLPDELKISIITKYYAGWDLSIIDNTFGPPADGEYFYPYFTSPLCKMFYENGSRHRLPLSKCRVVGPRMALMLTCKDIRNIAAPIQHAAFSGVLETDGVIDVVRTMKLTSYLSNVHTISFHSMPKSFISLRIQDFPALQTVRCTSVDLPVALLPNDVFPYAEFMSGNLDDDFAAKFAREVNRFFPIDIHRHLDKLAKFRIELRQVLWHRWRSPEPYPCHEQTPIAWMNIEYYSIGQGIFMAEVTGRAISNDKGYESWEKTLSAPVGKDWKYVRDFANKWPWDFGRWDGGTHHRSTRLNVLGSNPPKDTDRLVGEKEKSAFITCIPPEFPSSLGWVDFRVFCRGVWGRKADPI